MLSDDRQIKDFDDVGNNHYSWALSAHDLLAASRLLRKQKAAFDIESVAVGAAIPDEGSIHRADLLLRGFAVECLLKALWVKQGGVICTDGKYKGIKGVGNHNLCQLCDVNNLLFSIDQRDVLDRLSIFITSVGRYPIATDWSKTKKMGGGVYWMSPSDDEAFDLIISNLYKALE